MPNVNYVGVGRPNGGNGDLEREKTEALRLSNEITRAKLAKMRGDVLDRKMVVFAVESSWTLLRERVMTLPTVVAAELRDLGYDRHTVRLRVDAAIRRFLNEVAEHLEHATSAEDFLAGFDDEAETKSAEQKAAAERKKDAANAKRREKRNAAKPAD
jgi:hypothetical protein